MIPDEIGGARWRAQALRDEQIPAAPAALRAERRCDRACCTQATRCARCGERKHTPWRASDGYVCVACLGAADAARRAAEQCLRQSEAVIEVFVREYVKHPEEYLKWRRGEPHLCLSCAGAPPFNGCSALCPKCHRPAEAA